jgi:hypothetical protein
MFNRVSADGYFAGPDGNLDWVGGGRTLLNDVSRISKLDLRKVQEYSSGNVILTYGRAG